MADKKLEFISIDQIAQNPIALRSVDRQSIQFINLRDSIQKQGVLNPINVRPSKEGSEQPYELIDGLHRFMAALEAGLTSIPCQIIAMADAQVLEAQLMANVHLVKTKPVEFARQIQRILSLNPILTLTQLAQQLATGPSWISERLGLLKLNKKIADLVDKDEITLTNAYALAKLPTEEQDNYIAQAASQAPSEFVPAVTARAKEIREAARTGKKADKPEFVALPRLRKRSELVLELDAPNQLKSMIKNANIKDPLKAAILILQWVLQMDSFSIESAKAKYNTKQKEIEAAKIKRQAERDSKRAKNSAQMAATVTEEK